MKNLTKLTAVVLLLVMVALTILSGTYAKYTGSRTGTGTATVAYWHVKVNDADIATTSTSFELFSNSNIFDTNEATMIYGKGVKDNEVTNNLIAPGTWGYTTIKVSYDAQVDSTGKFTLAKASGEGNTDLPLKFSVVMATSDTALSEAKPGGWEDLSNFSKELDFGKGTATTNYIVIFWKWDYESKVDDVVNTTVDSNDTTIGAKDASVTMSLTAQLTVTQAD